MGRYWDIPEDKRADLTRDQVAECCQYQLMEKGTVVPPMPAGPPAKPDVKVPTITVWMVGRPQKYGSIKHVIGCLNRDDAEKIAAMTLVEIETDYSIPSEYQFAKTTAAVALEPIEVFDHAGLESVRVTLTEYKTALREYDQAVDDRNKAEKAATAAVADIWDDWRERRSQREREGVLVHRFNQYRHLCRESPNPAAPAWRFLIQSESADACQRALERAGVVFIDGLPVAVPLSL